ncbi:MAG: ABC transporter permease [Alphaproteobacteria bacterium]|nr:ABC transporter permease [Alphaproteobacteria bacterium]
MVYLSPVIALAATVLSGLVLFTIMNFDFASGTFVGNPFDPLVNFFYTPLTGRNGLTNLALKATPLVLIAIGLAMCYRANVWNIGAEGQFTLGAIAGTGVALAFWGTDSPLVLPAMIVAAMAGGLVWAAIPAFLKTRFNASELLVSLMLVYVATQILFYLVIGPWKDPEGLAFPQTRSFHDAARIPTLWEGIRVNYGSTLALLAVFGGWLVMGRSLLGFQIKVAGTAPRAARFAGFSERRTIWLVLMISGALAGLSGIVEVAGTAHQLGQVISPGYGFTAIIVAFLGRLNPIGILFAGLVMALSFLGSDTVQITDKLPHAIGSLFQGVLLFFLLGTDVLIAYRIVWRRRKFVQPELSH